MKGVSYISREDSFLIKESSAGYFAANSFLCTQVTRATEEDKKYCLLGFLKGAKDKVLTLTPKNFKIEPYIDASFAPHHDSKSHTYWCCYLCGQSFGLLGVEKAEVCYKISYRKQIGSFD